MRNPTTILELVEAIKLANAAQQREAGELTLEQRTLKSTQGQVDRPAVPSPRDEPMFTAASTPPARTCLAGCIVHNNLPVGVPEADVRVNEKPVWVILDSGSVVSLVHSNNLSP
ncbi:hypothetical protein F2P79_006287 [Pimephales promelas]|nr:hypothetical protein F2P79_006287 [Pimephales promelas]